MNEALHVKLNMELETLTHYLKLSELPNQTCWDQDVLGRLVVIHNNRVFFQRYTNSIIDWRYADIPPSRRVMGALWNVVHTDEETEPLVLAVEAIRK